MNHIYTLTVAFNLISNISRFTFYSFAETLTEIRVAKKPHVLNLIL